HTAIGISQQGETSFTLADLQQSNNLGTTKSFGSGQLLGSTIGALASSADVKVELATLGVNLGLITGLLNGLLSIIFSQLQPILSAVLVPVDAIIDGLLNELGIGIGEADLTLRNVACDKIVLVR